MAATKTKKKRGKAGGASEAAAADERPPILGVVPNGELRQISLDLIDDPPGPSDRLQRPGDEQEILEVARSMREVGQLQPVMLEAKADGRFDRVFGRRRIKAARLNREQHGGPETILAIVVPTLAPDARRTIVAVENIQRKDLSAAEEHLAVAELLELQAIPAAVQLGKPLKDGCGAYSGLAVTPYVAEEMLAASDAAHRAAQQHDLLLDHRVRSIACNLVAAMLAKSPTWVRDRMYVGRLGPKGRELVLAGKLPLAHARHIAKVGDADIREQLAEAYAAGGHEAISDTEAGRLEQLEYEVSKCLFSLAVVPWKLDAPVGDKPPCEGCPHNSATNPGLFDHGGRASDKMVGGRGQSPSEVDEKDLAAGICTLHSCYGAKLRATKGAVAAAAKKIIDGAKPSEVKVREFVSPKAVEEKVRQRRKMLRHNDGRSGRVDNDRAKAAMARENAKWNHQQACRQRNEKIIELVKRKVKKDPMARAALVLLEHTRLTGKPGPECLGYIRRAAKADGTLLEELAKKLPDSAWWPQVWGMPNAIAEAYGEAFGVEMPALPKLADFLPKTEAAKPAKKKAAKKKAPGKKKAKKKKVAKRGAGVVREVAVTENAGGQCTVCGDTDEEIPKDGWANKERTLCKPCAADMDPSDLEE